MAEQQQFIPNPTPPRWRVSIKGRRAPCAADVPVHFASTSFAGANTIPVVVDTARDAFLHITAYAIMPPELFSQTVCSPGGTPLQPRVVYEETGDNLVPLPPEQIIGTTGYAVLTEVAKRQVADVHAVAADFSVRFDVFGRCQFGNEIVEADQPFWTHTTYPPGRFSFSITEVNGLEEVTYIAISPGGVRFR